jgi:phenylpropionate dioxygenase-like ring-hydroxylating dioxygenase large terminal subunit
VAFSRDLAPGELKPLQYFGRALVLHRSQSGRAVPMDAYCPHLGAHIDHGGTVEGDEIRCPSHHWRFGPDGACTAIPWADRPMKVDVGTFPVVERNGVICAWHDAAQGPPSWRPSTHPLPDGPAIGAHVFMDDVVVHVQEVMENNTDFRRRCYREILPSMKADGLTVLAVTHDDDHFDACDRRLVMEDGVLRPA